jgi:hypothetical protein
MALAMPSRSRILPAIATESVDLRQARGSRWPMDIFLTEAPLRATPKPARKSKIPKYSAFDPAQSTRAAAML